MELTDARPVIEKPKRTGNDKYRLRQMRSDLIDELDPTEIEKLLDSLYAEDIFKTVEKDEVYYENVPEKKMRKLLDILEGKVVIPKDPPVLDFVVDFLREHDHDNLAQKLIEADGIPEGFKEVEEVLKIAEGMELTDQVLGGVVRNVGSSWEPVAHQLGVTDIKIGNITSVIREPYQQKFKVFHAWKQMSGYRPGSLIVLLKAFKDNYDECVVNWPLISTYLKSIKDKQLKT